MKFNLRAIGAELILGTMVFPWVVWITISVFNSQKAEAVQDSKYDYIARRLDEIRADVKELRK